MNGLAVQSSKPRFQSWARNLPKVDRGLLLGTARFAYNLLQSKVYMHMYIMYM